MRNEATLEMASPGLRLEAIKERGQRLLEPAIFWSLLALIPLTAIPYGTFQTWWVAVFECSVFALTALWVVHGLLSGAWNVKGLTLLIPAIALLLLAFAQTLPLYGATVAPAGIQGEVWNAISADPYATRLFAFELLALTLAAALLLRFTSSPQRLRSLIHVVIGAGVASALFGIMRQTIQGDAQSFVLALLAPNQGYGQFVNPNHFAYLMEMTFGLILGLMVGGGVRRDRLLIYLAAATPVWLALVLSNSRGGIFSMICQAIFLALVFCFAHRRRKTSDDYGANGLSAYLARSFVVRAALTVCLVMAIFVGVVWLGGDPLAQRVESVEKEFGIQSETVRSNTTRWDTWGAGWQLIKHNPVLGVGFGGFPVAFPQYHDGSGELRTLRAMNDYVDLVAGGGLIGLALAVWFIIMLIKRSRERLRSRDRFRRAATLGALTGILGVACHSFVDYGLQMTAIALVFVFLVTIATADVRVEADLST